MTAQLKARTNEFVAHLPELACTQPEAKKLDAVQASSRIGNVVTVDFGSRQEPPPAKTIGASVDVAGLIQNLFSSGWQVKFGYLATIRGERAARYRYSQAGGGPYADVYTNSDTGFILRIVFHGFDTPGHFASYHCSDSGAN